MIFMKYLTFFDSLVLMGIKMQWGKKCTIKTKPFSSSMVHLERIFTPFNILSLKLSNFVTTINYV
jgi:hypothetical protein